MGSGQISEGEHGCWEKGVSRPPAKAFLRCVTTARSQSLKTDINCQTVGCGSVGPSQLLNRARLSGHLDYCIRGLDSAWCGGVSHVLHGL